MRKKSDDNKAFLQVDPINGDYYISIPEWMINELSWYEDTEIKISLDGGEIIIAESTDE
jgi:hypothetical protein